LRLRRSVHGRIPRLDRAMPLGALPNASAANRRSESSMATGTIVRNSQCG
jgi:hypothetical protein